MALSRRHMKSLAVGAGILFAVYWLVGRPEAAAVDRQHHSDTAKGSPAVDVDAIHGYSGGLLRDFSTSERRLPILGPGKKPLPGAEFFIQLKPLPPPPKKVELDPQAEAQRLQLEYEEEEAENARLEAEDADESTDERGDEADISPKGPSQEARAVVGRNGASRKSRTPSLRQLSPPHPPPVDFGDDDKSKRVPPSFAVKDQNFAAERARLEALRHALPLPPADDLDEVEEDEEYDETNTLEDDESEEEWDPDGALSTATDEDYLSNDEEESEESYTDAPIQFRGEGSDDDQRPNRLSNPENPNIRPAATYERRPDGTQEVDSDPIDDAEGIQGKIAEYIVNDVDSSAERNADQQPLGAQSPRDVPIVRRKKLSWSDRARPDQDAISQPDAPPPGKIARKGKTARGSKALTPAQAVAAAKRRKAKAVRRPKNAKPPPPPGVEAVDEGGGIWVETDQERRQRKQKARGSKRKEQE